MPQKPGATLVAEIGSVTTRVTLIDIVDGEMRMIGQTSVPSTTEPPLENAVIGILEAATQLSETTGRQLMRDGSLLMPQTAERDGIDALIQARQDPPDLVVLDLMIPGIDGLEVCRRLRASRDAARALPIIMVTAKDSIPDRVMGLKTGADDYIEHRR